MHRKTPRLTTAVLAALAFAACQDHAPTVTAPSAGPVMAKGGNGGGKDNGNKQLDAGPRSSAGITPVPYAGNTPGNPNATCASLGLTGGFGVEDGATAVIVGYRFAASGDDNSTLAFAPAPGVAPEYAVTAVVVKGGPAYDVYRYANNTAAGAAVTSDGNLAAPRVGKGGKNLPGISHFVVCTSPIITVKKTLVAVKTLDGNNQMIDDPSYGSGGPVVIPQGQTRWLQFRVDYQQPAGSTGKLTDDYATSCGSLGGGFSCTTAGFDGRSSLTATVTGPGTRYIMIDVKNGGCGDGTFTNKVMFDVPPIWVNATASVSIVGQCVSKKLVNVYSSVRPDGSMIQDATYVPATPSSVAKVTIPQGQTRWLEYEISYTLGGNGSGSLLENLQSSCDALNAQYGGYSCTSAGFEGRGGLSTTVGGTGTILIMIDIKNDHACHDRDFVNTATLTRSNSGGPATTATAPAVMIWARDC